jgi:methylated-DNA-[protein]-cysteine S-methyltransferase
MKKYCVYHYKFCNLFIGEENGAVRFVSFRADKIPKEFEKSETPLIKKAAMQLNEYFNKDRQNFDLPLTLRGTDFQIKVWTALQKIPYGETSSYGELAVMIGNPKACRAVGMANNRNPITIIIPCHRVIGHNGSLTGYGGGLELKQKLLDLETLTMLSGKGNKRDK